MKDRRIFTTTVVLIVGPHGVKRGCVHTTKPRVRVTVEVRVLKIGHTGPVEVKAHD